MALLGKAALAMWWDIAPDIRAEFEHWHSQEHFPERLALPGFRRASRWRSADGGDGFFVMYELESYEVLSSPPYLERLNNPSPWSMRMMPQHRNMVRCQCRVLESRGAGVAGHLLTVRLSPGHGRADALRSMLDDWAARPGILGVHLLQHEAPSIAETTEQRIRGGDRSADWVLLVVADDLAALERLAHGDLGENQLAQMGAAAATVRALFGLSHSAMPLMTDLHPAPIEPAIVRAFAPTGRLRASINLGNPILANRNPANGDPVGVSIDLAQALAQRLGVACELVVFDTAGKSVEALAADQADIGFFAIDPLRGEGISFTPPYVLIEGSYLVRSESPIQDNGEVDRDGVRVTVGKGSAYDLFLTRELRQASIVRAPTSPAVVDMFLAQALEVAAGVRQQLEADAARRPGLRLLPGRFMVIQQAMGTPRSRGGDAAAFLSGFVEQMKASGFVADALRRHGIQGASVAPGASV